MPTTPSWEAASNGIPGNLNATNHASQVSQLLGSHAVTPIYAGSQILTPAGGDGYGQFFPGNGRDMAQPFIMPGGKTVVGRVAIPIISYGNGADVLVSLVPDNAGVPNMSNILASTSVPASWITNLGAPNGLQNGGPLATPANNSMAFATNITTTPWGALTVDGSGTGLSFTATTISGNFLISAGGKTSTPTAAVVTAQFTGAGTVATPMVQPSLPAASYFGTLAATTGTLVYTGGNNNVTPLLSTVYTASWNQSTGAVGAWSAQASLPIAIQHACSAASGNTVYVAGGVDNTPTVRAEVYYATVSNGQITAWNKGPALPTAVQQAAMGVVNGWLILAGGSTTAPSNTPSGAVYFAKINSDGSLGTWQTGPSLPVPAFTFSPGWNMAVTDSAFHFILGQTSSSTNSSSVQTLTVTSNGLSTYWKHGDFGAFSGAQMTGAFSVGNGSWELFLLNFAASSYSWTTVVPMPLISVPLYATGLTPGNKYHVVIQQHQYLSSSDFIGVGIDNGAYPNDALDRLRNTGTWGPNNTGFSIPLVIYDNTPGGNVLHTWEDPSSTGSTSSSNIAARASSLVYNSISQLIGLCDSVRLPNDTLNKNPTFTSGVGNWTAHNCTFVQSNAQVHGGFPFSGLMTPNGVASAPNVTSELVPVAAFSQATSSGQWYAANGWFYSPTGWSNVSLSVDWYTSTQVYITTTNATATLAAATWTNLVSYHKPPAGAAFASINFIESGTPAAGNTVYFSNVTIQASPEVTQPFSSVAQLTYNNPLWSPVGVSQLA
jgi:hypothetical protein